MIEEKPDSIWTQSRLFDIVSSILMAIVFLALGYMLGQSRWAPLNFVGLAADTPPEAREAFESFWEVWQLVNNNHLNQPLDQSVLAEGAITGMLATLDDPYTAYLSPDRQEMAAASFEGELEGIGTEVQSVDGAFTIVSPYDGSPAAKAGLQPHDIILEANGTPLTGLDITAAAALVRGPAGSEVTLKIDRGGEQFEVTITRGVIDIPSVRSQDLGDGLTLIRLSQFGEETASDFSELLAGLVETDMRGIVLDLRRNPGGSLNSVTAIADQFLSDGTILIEENAAGDRDPAPATDRGLALDIPLVVLIDEGSASASEVLAGALQDQKRAVLVGNTSFGKGTIQQWISLSNGGGVRITVARWLTPDGRWVHNEGLTPDFPVSAPPADGLAEGVDPQLDAAVNYLLELLNSQPISADQ